ncbi:unnamed protein product [Rhizoctonia solani]|uniref:BZIP domain-containing protein n=1 Tax=Rhizoctonia solani TaxID=456999 RepID=A0A8H3CHP6_9AGAM|nr:unnamed protein product [Rhizoctonia solani]
MAFDAQALWDLTSPITMPSMSDNDFLMLLEKQMQAAHPTSGNAGAATTDGQQSFSNNNMMVTPSSVMGPPPVPADTMTPPLTEESSPSPSASANDNVNVGDGSKRKASRDDSGNPDGQPRAKVQHKANEDSVNSQPTDESTKKAPPRRKSSGTGTASEEGRLAKRKEQNRAAQRAFRDRKEKHVRDLEDKIQELEQKFNTSESENTNLKDLLKRLQNENMMLKQSAFTFEFAPTDKSTNLTATSPTANTSSSLSSVGTNPFTSPSHSHSSASPESTTANYVSKSPNNSLFTSNNTPSPNITSDSRENVTVNSAGMLSFSNPSTAQPTPATPALSSVTSPGAGPSSLSQSAFTQTSLFTSYRDPSYSLGLPFGDFNAFGSVAGNSGIEADFGMDFGMDMGNFGTNDLGAFGLGSDFDDLFGGQLGVLEGTSSYGGVGSVASPSSAGMLTSAPTPQSTSASTAATPAPSQPPLIIDGLPSVGESARVECSIKAPSASDWRRCPKTKQDFVDLIRNDTSKPSTFGPALTSDDHAQIEQDWEKFKEHPEAKELDVDNLCYELFDKAQCTELKSRMKQSMMRIAKDLANGSNAA